MAQNNDDILHQEELKHYLTDRELLLPDVEREKLLTQKKLVDLGLLRERDLIGNHDNSLMKQARRAAISRNKLSLIDVFENYTKLFRCIIYIIGLICLASLYYVGNSILS